MDVQILEDIGLTNAEIKVYLALLELGTTTAGPIIEKSDLQSSVVHTTLHKLIEKGFISFVKEGKIHHYQAADPKHIIDFIEEKKNRFEDLLPSLLAKQSLTKNRQEVTVFRGIKGIKELLYELLDAGGKEHHIIGSPFESNMMGSAFWTSYHTKRSAKGIVAKLIFNNSYRGFTKNIKYPEKTTEIRFTEKGFEPLTEIIIRNDKVATIIWTQKPIGILIHQKELAESYETYFQMDWKNAKR